MLDVIGVGYSRTGTYSLKTALDRLGFGPCHHGFELMRYPEQVPRWERTLEGNIDWERIFEGYRSTTDYPSLAYWRETIRAFPDARVILTVRDPEHWFESFQVSVMQQMNKVAAESPDRANTGEEGARPPLARLMDNIFQGIDLRDRDGMIERFQQHKDEVRASVRPERLLEFEVKQGWGPLCEFLGVDVPDVEFPRTNDPTEFERLIERFRSEAGRSPW